MADNAHGFLGVSVPVFTVTLAGVAACLYLQYRRTRRIEWAGWWATFALIAATLQTALLWAAIRFGFGQSNPRTDDNQFIRSWLTQISFIIGSWSMTLEKISAAAQLRMVEERIGRRVFLRIGIGFLVISVVAGNVLQVVQMVQFARCWPTEASLGHRIPNASCGELTLFQISIYIMGGSAVATNVLFALRFVWIISKARMGLGEKVIVTFLICFRVFFSAFIALKMVSVTRLGTADVLSNSVTLATWSVVEDLTSIFGGCVPTFKAALENVCRRIGWSSDSSSTESTERMRRASCAGTATEMAAESDRDRVSGKDNTDRTDTIELVPKDVESGASEQGRCWSSHSLMESRISRDTS